MSCSHDVKLATLPVEQNKKTSAQRTNSPQDILEAGKEGFALGTEKWPWAVKGNSPFAGECPGGPTRAALQLLRAHLRLRPQDALKLAIQMNLSERMFAVPRNLVRFKIYLRIFIFCGFFSYSLIYPHNDCSQVTK